MQSVFGAQRKAETPDACVLQDGGPFHPQQGLCVFFKKTFYSFKKCIKGPDGEIFLPETSFSAGGCKKFTCDILGDHVRPVLSLTEKNEVTIWQSRNSLTYFTQHMGKDSVGG